MAHANLYNVSVDGTPVPNTDTQSGQVQAFTDQDALNLAQSLWGPGATITKTVNTPPEDVLPVPEPR